MTRPGVTMSMWPWWRGHVSHLTSGADNMKINWTWSHLRRRRKEPVCLGESWNVWRVTILLTWGHVWHLTSPAHPLSNTQLTLLSLLPDTICYKCYKSLASIGFSITAWKCCLEDKCDHYVISRIAACWLQCVLHLLSTNRSSSSLNSPRPDLCCDETSECCPWPLRVSGAINIVSPQH